MILEPLKWGPSFKLEQNYPIIDFSFNLIKIYLPLKLHYATFKVKEKKEIFALFIFLDYLYLTFLVTLWLCRCSMAPLLRYSYGELHSCCRSFSCF